MVARPLCWLRALMMLLFGLGCLAEVATAQFFGPSQPPQQQQQPQQQQPRYAETPPPAQYGRPAQQRPIRRVSNEGNAGPHAPAQLPAPFQLTPPELKYLDEVLDTWQKTTGGIKTFKSDFTRWEYDPVWATGANQGKALSISTGRVLYAKPDKGTFRVDEVKRIDQTSGDYKKNDQEVGEHWVCDGRSIWEFNSKEKLVVERTLPAEMQGKAINGGPLPFLFGVEAPKLKNRYYLRVITPQDLAEKEVWIDARPRFPADAANFKMAVLILNGKTYHPYALRLYEPSGEKYTTYQFTEIKIDDPFEWFKRDFAEPRVPFGWKKIKEDIPQAGSDRTANGQSNPAR